MAQLPTDSQEKHANGFRCCECDNVHDVTDLFLWSSCQHKYGRGCVLFCIQRQLYDKKLPICIVDKCTKLLLEDAAQLVLPHEILMEFYQTHNDYQQPQNQNQNEKNTLNDDERKNSGMNNGPQYVSLAQSNETDSSSDGQINDVINGTQIPYRIKTDPADDSSDAEITYDNTEQQPLLNNINNNGHYNTYNNNNNLQLFECILCKNKHITEQIFKWTKCKHSYGRQCAENMIIEWLFKRDIPKCINCKTQLSVLDAMNLLQFDAMQEFKEIYVLKASLETFNAEQQNKNNNDTVDINSSKKTSNTENEISNQSEIKPNASISDQTEKHIKKEPIETKENNNNNNNNNNDKLQPSILMLPDNNFHALIPMDDDFIDDNGIILNAKKEAELQNKNLFYCSRCKNLISLLENPNNGKYIPTKCLHVSCKQCAKKHTKHEMEMLQVIPTCQICSLTILDTDLIDIWGKHNATQLMNALFKEKSLKLPPADPAAAAALITTEITTAGVENVTDNINDRDNENEAVEINILEEKSKENEINKSADLYGHCLTEHCNKKGLLSTEKDEESRLNCIYCGNIWCIKCGVEWHLGQTCEQYRNDLNDNNDNIIYALQQEQQNMQFDGYDDILNGYYDKNEQAFQQMYNQNDLRTCPVCGRTYEKDGGCNRIKCHCGISFCWLCENIVDANGNDNHYEKGICKLND